MLLQTLKIKQSPLRPPQDLKSRAAIGKPSPLPAEPEEFSCLRGERDLGPKVKFTPEHFQHLELVPQEASSRSCIPRCF